MLKAGQIIRYDSALWRVEYVNASRARIVPLLKRHVSLKNDAGQETRSFETDQRGASISPNSLVEVVTATDDLEDEIEMMKLEKEIADLKAQAERETKAETARLTAQSARAARRSPARMGRTPEVGPSVGLPQAAAPQAKPTPTIGQNRATIGQAPLPTAASAIAPAAHGARGAGWYLVEQTEVIPGSLKAAAVAYVAEHPGQTTKQIAAQITGWNLSAVAACLDRFRKAGVMVASADLATRTESKPKAKAPKTQADDGLDF
jgi:hypothetical protein